MKRILLIAFCLALGACGETKTLRLSYSLATNAQQEEPNLILALRLSDSGALEASFNEATLPGSLNTSLLRQLLQGCAIEQNEVDSDAFPDAVGDTCEDLGLEIGEGLLASQAVSTDTNAELGVGSTTAYIFVLFIYSADNLDQAADRCVMLKTLEVANKRISANGQTASSLIQLELANRVSSNLGPDNQNCYPLL